MGCSRQGFGVFAVRVQGLDEGSHWPLGELAVVSDSRIRRHSVTALLGYRAHEIQMRDEVRMQVV